MPDEKMKYPLLEFEYDKKLYEELLTLNPHPEFMDRVSIVTEDYEHDDFGSLPGDEKNALGHAAGVLWKIQKYGLSFSDEESKTIRTRKRSHTKKPDLLLFVNDEDAEEIAYYTSAEVFSYMLPEKCTEEDDTADRLGKLTVMHLSYMNDPNEGKTLQKAIYGPSYGALQKGRKPLDVPFVFVKCFSPRIDYLPMWEMYGDHARGCCLVIDWKASKWMEEEAEPVLYHVCYLRKQGNSYVVLNEDNEKLSRSCRAINSQLQELHNVAEEIAEQDRRYLDDVLGKVLYLFKDSSYSYEQELRVIYQTEENILHTKPKDPKDKPWLFVQTPFPLELDEVILGPKFPDVSTRVPYLQEQIYEMCDETDTTRPRITLSEINYR